MLNAGLVAGVGRQQALDVNAYLFMALVGRLPRIASGLLCASASLR